MEIAEERMAQRDAADVAYVPAPYTVEADEVVTCPDCGRMNSNDARHCDQCGNDLTCDGRIPMAYQAEADEVIQCPVDGAMNSDDARFCDQCGTSLVGLVIVEPEDAAPAEDAEPEAAPEADALRVRKAKIKARNYKLQSL